jgi:hypothetical protein
MLAGFGALLAMVVLVLGAFFAAGLANDRAQPAKLIDQPAFAGHQYHRQTAHIGAITIELNAGGHHLYIVFFQAGGRAYFTGRGAGIARLYAGCILGRVHG